MLGLKSSVGILKIHPTRTYLTTPAHSHTHPTHTCSWPELHEIRVNRKMADRR